MPRIIRFDHDTLGRLRRAIEDYRQVLEDSTLSKTSVAGYVDGADRFVRWLDGHYVPPRHR